jgi:hypothetical protein
MEGILMMRFMKIRTLDGAITGSRSDNILPDTALGITVEQTDDETVSALTHWWNGTAFAERTKIDPITVKALVELPIGITIADDAYTTVDNRDLLMGTRSITPSQTGTSTLTYSGQYAGTIIVEATTLDEAKASRRAEVNAIATMKTSGSCESSVGIVQCDPASRDAISTKVTMAMLAKMTGASFSIVWRRTDNTYSDVLDADGMIALGESVEAFMTQCVAAQFAAKDTIDACTTLEEIDAVDVSAGYP